MKQFFLRLRIGACALIDWALQLEEINGGGRCPTYLYRWALFHPRWKPLRKLANGFSIYVHKFVREDWTKDLHDHPKPFISIGLRGGYREQTVEGESTWRAPWIRYFPAEHIHRLIPLDDKPCWTLIITLTNVRDWGFWHEGQWIQWKRYVAGFGGIADKMKSCQ